LWIMHDRRASESLICMEAQPGTSTPHDYKDVNDAMETAVNELLAGKPSPLRIVHEIVIERIA